MKITNKNTLIATLTILSFQAYSEGREVNVNNLESKITNGEMADNHDYPATVLLYNRHARMCTGTLVDKQWVLTAAHCSFDKIGIGLGLSVDGTLHSEYTEVDISNKINHPLYFPNLGEHRGYDIALIRLNKAVSYPIAPMNIYGSRPANGTKLNVAGYGNILMGTISDNINEHTQYGYSDFLYETSVTVVDDSKCDLVLDGVPEHNPESDICAGNPAPDDNNSNIFRGDSGSGLIDKNTGILYGVTSRMTTQGEEEGTFNNEYSTFTDVSNQNISDWIATTIGL